MKSVVNAHPQPRTASASGPSSIALYPMSAYTEGIRKAGHFHVIHFEDGHSERVNRFVPHRHDFFEIIWLRSGRGHVRSDLRSFPVGPRTLFFTSPGQIHSWDLDGPAKGEIASFTEEFFSVTSDNPGLLSKMPFLYAGAHDPILQLSVADGARIDQVFRHLHAEASEPALGRDDLVRSYVTILLTHARQFFARRAPGEAAPAQVADLLSRRFRCALEEHFPQLLEVGDFAKLLGVSRTHLNEHLQRETGRPASEIIHERIVLEAKRLLTHTSLTSAQIAFRLRFRDPSYFGRFFRRSAGTTPGKYRASVQTETVEG